MNAEVLAQRRVHRQARPARDAKRSGTVTKPTENSRKTAGPLGERNAPIEKARARTAIDRDRQRLETQHADEKVRRGEAKRTGTVWKRKASPDEKVRRGESADRHRLETQSADEKALPRAKPRAGTLARILSLGRPDLDQPERPQPRKSAWRSRVPAVSQLRQATLRPHSAQPHTKLKLRFSRRSRIRQTRLHLPFWMHILHSRYLHFDVQEHRFAGLER